MGLGLTEAGDAGRMLGLFISRGGRKVKEVYNLLKNTPKATVGDPAAPVSEYRHARSIVDDKLKQEAEMQSDLYAFSACRGPSDNDKVLVLVDRVPLQMLPDTGASVTIIDRSSYDKLCQTGAYPLFKTDVRIFAYGSDDPLKLKARGGGKSFKKPKKLLFPKSIHFLTTEILLPLIYL